MHSFNSTLLREKFIVRDISNSGHSRPSDPIIATSNRLVVSLGENATEKFVVRGHTMYTTTRMAAVILRTYMKSGPILPRDTAFDWTTAYKTILPEQDAILGDKEWLCVYTGGKPVYSSGHHKFLDVIEQCDHKSQGDYEQSIRLAESAFEQAEHPKKIEHHSNVGLLINISNRDARIGILQRLPGKTSTFNFVVDIEPDRRFTPHDHVSAAASFLEAIQLSFFIGNAREQLKAGNIEKDSLTAKRLRLAERRLDTLQADLNYFDSDYDIKYRPERPKFSDIIKASQKQAKKSIQNEKNRQTDSARSH